MDWGRGKKVAPLGSKTGPTALRPELQKLKEKAGNLDQ